MLQYPKCNLHTHTVFSDGVNTPLEMVEEALKLGLHTLGFSDHSYTFFDPDCCSSPDQHTLARREVSCLQEKYAGRIRILCGLEQDFYSEPPAEKYDYLIGSVHYLFKDGVYHAVDRSAKDVLVSVRESFEGDIYRYTKEYYETVAQVVEKTNGQIVGHFDLIEKFNQDGAMFSSDDYRYRRPMIDALDALLDRDVIFEINTGAMSRGYRTAPYPSPYVLRRIAEKRGRVMLNSDAHRKENLTFAFEDAVQYAKACGVGGLTVFGAHGWELFPLRSR